VSKLGGELADIKALAAAHGRDALVAALERAVTYRRWRAADIRDSRHRRRRTGPTADRGVPR
jgi:hypothetical protein